MYMKAKKKIIVMMARQVDWKHVFSSARTQDSIFAAFLIVMFTATVVGSDFS